MYKAYKFRIYPNEEQTTLINKSFGCVRFVYNYYLNKIKENNYMNATSCIKDYVDCLKYEYPFLTEIDSIIIRKSLFNLEDSFKRFFNKISDYPKYKSKFSRNSYNTSAIYRTYKGKRYCNIEVDVKNRKIKLPKLKWVNYKGYRNLEELPGRIMNATISREPNGKYYVSILVDIPFIDNYFIKPNSIVGIDLGIKKLVTLSDNVTFDNNKYILKYEKRIKRCQRELSRKTKKSNNYYKCKKKLAVLFSKLKNARKFYTHYVTKNITDNYDVITCEKLNTKSMIMRKELSKSITDATFYELIIQLEYKSKWKGKYFYQVDKYYPSSQTCSICENINQKYKNLTQRIYKCYNCSNTIDRDLNASINIMFEGLKLHMKNFA